MPSVKDGPSSPLFSPVSFRGRYSPGEIAKAGVSKETAPSPLGWPAHSLARPLSCVACPGERPSARSSLPRRS